MAEFVQTNRGGKALHYEGYVYHKIREGKEGSTFWHCQLHKSGCSGRATSDGASVVVRNEHNHPPAHSTLRKEKAVANMRKRAREETTSINQINFTMKHCRCVHVLIMYSAGKLV